MSLQAMKCFLCSLKYGDSIWKAVIFNPNDKEVGFYINPEVPTAYM